MAKKKSPVSEVQAIINEVIKKDKEKNIKDNQELKATKAIIEEKSGIINWDFALNDEVPFFDSELSYELTGYRPINETRGLKFKTS